MKYTLHFTNFFYKRERWEWTESSVFEKKNSHGPYLHKGNAYGMLGCWKWVWRRIWKGASEQLLCSIILIPFFLNWLWSYSTVEGEKQDFYSVERTLFSSIRRWHPSRMQLLLFAFTLLNSYLTRKHCSLTQPHKNFFSFPLSVTEIPVFCKVHILSFYFHNFSHQFWGKGLVPVIKGFIFPRENSPTHKAP